jgi:hypothetical protein
VNNLLIAIIAVFSLSVNAAEIDDIHAQIAKVKAQIAEKKEAKAKAEAITFAKKQVVDLPALIDAKREEVEAQRYYSEKATTIVSGYERKILDLEVDRDNAWIEPWYVTGTFFITQRMDYDTVEIQDAGGYYLLNEGGLFTTTGRATRVVTYSHNEDVVMQNGFTRSTKVYDDTPNAPAQREKMLMKSGYYRYVEIIKETRGELRNALNNAKEANDKVKVLESELSQLEDRFERAQKVLEEM